MPDKPDPCDHSLQSLRVLIAELEKRFDRHFEETDKRYEQRFLAQREATMHALASAALATEKEEKNSEKWRQSANEWRAAMGDREAEFFRKSEAEMLRGDIRELKSRMDIVQGRSAGLHNGWIILVAAVGLLIAAAGVFYKH